MDRFLKYYFSSEWNRTKHYNFIWAVKYHFLPILTYLQTKYRDNIPEEKRVFKIAYLYESNRFLWTMEALARSVSSQYLYNVSSSVNEADLKR